MSTFGYETIGGSDQALAADEQIGVRVQCGFDGVLYSMGAYIKDALTSEYFRYFIYSDNTGVPNELLAMSRIVIGTGSSGWQSADLMTPITVSNGTYYWIGVHTDAPITLTYDSGSENTRIITRDFWTWPLQPWSGGSDVAREYSIYADTALVTATKKWIGIRDTFKKALTEGGNSYGPAGNGILINSTIAPENITLKTFYMYVGDLFQPFETGWHIKGVIYANDGGYPGALLGITAPIAGDGTARWYSGDFLSPIYVIAGETYWIGALAELGTDYIDIIEGQTSFIDIYEVTGDDYSDPSNPFQNPPAYTDWGGLSMYAEAASEEVPTTFGLESIGASDDAISSLDHLVCRFQCGFDGIIYKLAIYLKDIDPAMDCGFTIYDDSGSAPNNLLMFTNRITLPAIDGWYIAELIQPIEVSYGINYWLGFYGSGNVTLTYDTTLVEEYRVISDPWGGAPINPWSGGSNVNRKYSMYASSQPIDKKWIGYKGIGTIATQYIYGPGQDETALTKIIAIEDLTIDTIGAYTSTGFGVGQYSRGVIYSDNGGSPGTLLAQTDPFEGTGADEFKMTAALQSPLNITNGVSYWIGFQTDTDWMDTYEVTVDFLGAEFYYVADTYSDGPEDPCNSPPNDNAAISEAYFLEAESGGGGSDAQPGIMVDML